MTSPGRRRHYREYMAPGEQSPIPRQTLCNRRKNSRVADNKSDSVHNRDSTDDRAPAGDSGSTEELFPADDRDSINDPGSSQNQASAESIYADVTLTGSAEQEELGSISGQDGVCTPMASEQSGQGDPIDDSPAESSVCFATGHDFSQEPYTDVFFDCQESVASQTSDAAPSHGIEDQEPCADDEDAEARDYFEQASKETLPNKAMTKAQAVLLILCLVVSGGFSWTQVDGILKLINTLLGTTVVPDSKYMFRKLWRQKMSTISFHYYCHTCFCYLGIRPSNNLPEEKVTCESCNEIYEPRTLIARGHFFLTFNIKRQLQSMFSTLGEPICHTLKRTFCDASGVYTDIFDGRLYQSIRRQMNMTWSDVTVTLNTDGSPVFKSSKSSVWPIQVILNELPIHLRFRNVIVGGLWFAKMHPPAHLFMRTFVEEFAKIGSIIWRHAEDHIISRVFAVCCSVDSPARAVLLNMKQFNGYFGCSWCLEEGTLVNGTLRYILHGSPAQDRTHTSVVKDAKAAFRQGQPVNGIKGPSVLLPLKGLDLVWCLPPDYMHCVLEGVTKQFTELWLSATGAPYYIGGVTDALNSRIHHIRPPISFCRLPRSISERAHWKANEWQYWLLFYSLPCLINILPTRYLHHYSLLCQAIFLLLGTRVTSADVAEAEKLLLRFVERIVPLYGHSAATFNVHQLLHLSKSVEMLGPLWGFSTFPFENGNGHLLRHVTAAQGVPQQIAERCVMHSFLSVAKRLVHLSDSLVQRCQKITQILHKPDHGVHLLGAPRAPRLRESVEQMLFQKYGALPHMSAYDRLCVDTVVFHTASYARPQKTCSAYLKMKDGNYCVLENILSFSLPENRIVLVCQELIMSNCGFGEVMYTQKCEHPPPHANLCLYHPTDIADQCVFIQQDGEMYLCDRPNPHCLD